MKYLFTLLFAIFIISNSIAQTQKANINTSRSNIKKGLNNPADSLQQKANINTSRSNTKGGLNKPADSLLQKANHNTARSNKSTVKGDGGSPADSLQQKANINTSRSNIKKGIKNPTDSLQQNKGYDATHRLTRGTSSSVKGDGGNPIDSLQQKANINTSRSNIKKGIINPTDSLQQKEASSMNNPYFVDNAMQGNMLVSQQGGIEKYDLKRGIKDSNNGGAQKPAIYFGGGYSILNDETKENTKLTTANEINIGAYFPLIKKAVVSYGINIDVEYSFSNKEVAATFPNLFSVEGQVSSSVALIKKSGPTQTGYAIALGPQINFPMGNKWILSPILQASHINIKQNGYSLEQTINNGRENYNFTIQSQPESKTSFFAVKPRIRLVYLLNDRLSLWTEANFTAGSSIEIITNQFSPEGVANPKGQYTLAQMQNGTFQEEVTSAKFNSFGFKFGLAVKLSK